MKHFKVPTKKNTDETLCDFCGYYMKPEHRFWRKSDDTKGHFWCFMTIVGYPPGQEPPSIENDIE